jgi:tRNA-modifying protein YgfZ
MPNHYYRLDHYEFIRISGADNINFLQGQVTCNTELLSQTRSLCGALCNLKGRVIADFRLLLHGEDIIMQCAAGMAEKILTTLGKYAVFSKVELEQIAADSPSFPRAIGVLDESVDAALSSLSLELPAAPNAVHQGANGAAILLSGPAKRVELWLFGEASGSAPFSSIGMQASESLGAWSRAEIESGNIHVTPAISEEYTPQLLNYDLSGLIDFKKGCYTGQEIVARMYYRGTAKKRLYLAESNFEIGDTSEIVEKGAEGLEAEHSAGEILSYSNDASPTLFLAILANDAVDGGTALSLKGQAGSEIRIQSLPYMLGSSS